MPGFALSIALLIFSVLLGYWLGHTPRSQRALWITAGILVGFCLLSFWAFSVLMNNSTFYEGIVFREIARNSYAAGELSRLLTAVFLLIMASAILLHSIQTTGNALETLKDVLFPTSRWGRFAMGAVLALLVIVSLESTCRKFYVREMVAYYNQLVAIANTPTYKASGTIKRFFNAKLAQMDTMDQFYAIEDELLHIIKATNQERPKRLREKFSLFDMVLTWSFPRGPVDAVFQQRLQTELQSLP